MNILVPNLGSTSIKYQILAMPAEVVLARGKVERVTDYGEGIARLETNGLAIDAVAFKAVHGGPAYRGTFLIDAGVIAALEEFLPAAPAHNTIYLAAIRAFGERMPATPLVAAFETEFHAGVPAYAREYGVPRSWRERGVARYGFHGASHQYVSERVRQMFGRDVKLVSCHLGGSSSMCAIRDGRSIETTMGFSPQSGLENATRHGDLDVFAALFMMEKHGWCAADLRAQLASEGGLAGISGIPGGDVRDLEAARTESARLALATLAYQVRKAIGAYAAAMNGLDAVAFTGGIGENSEHLRAACCRDLEFLGIKLDAWRNERWAGDRLISADGFPVTVLALATNEELVVARRAYACLERLNAQPLNAQPLSGQPAPLP